MNNTEAIETFCRENQHDPAHIVDMIVGVVAERKAEYLQYCNITAEESKRAKEKKLFICVAVQLLCKHALLDIGVAKEQLGIRLRDYERTNDNVMTTFCCTMLERLSHCETIQKNRQPKFAVVLPLCDDGKGDNKGDDDDDDC